MCLCSTDTSRTVRKWEAAEKFASCPIACPANTACNASSICICCDADEARQCVRVSLEVCFDAWPLELPAELRSLDILSGGRVNAQAIFDTCCKVKFCRRPSSATINFQYPDLTGDEV